jgi:hypothetical protein
MFVDVTPVSDVEQHEVPGGNIVFVEHPIIAYTQAAFPTSREPMVGERVQACAQVVDLPLEAL